MTSKWRFRHAMLLLVAAAACAGQVIAQDDLPQTTTDGLERTESPFQILYWRPGATLDQYRRIAILDCLVEFREDWLTDQNRGKLTFNTVTVEHVARIKNVLAGEFLEIVTEALEGDGGYEIVGVAGRDVVVLRPAILNLDVGADIYGRQQSLSSYSTAVSMTLVLEFYDSVTSTLIGRAIDSRTDRDNWDRVAVRQILGQWAGNMRGTLEQDFDGSK